MSSGPIHPYQLEESISNFRGVWLIEIHINSVDTDQTPHSAVSDLDLHCLHRSQKGTLGLYGLKGRVLRPPLLR